MHYLLIAAALAAGALMPIQGSLNARLGRVLPNPFQSSLTNFVVGALVLAVLCLAVRAPWPMPSALAAIPPRLYLGGVLGAIFVSTVLILVPRIGVLNVLASAVVGQLLVSILIDHFGWFDVPVQPVSFTRVAGALSLVGGLFLIQK